jgi:hypothetical protein
MVNSQNHVSAAVDAKEEEIRCKLARTLSHRIMSYNCAILDMVINGKKKT